MQPIRFFEYQQTVWYNLSDYIQVLLDTQTIYRQRPSSLHKRKRPDKSLFTILTDKINRLNPVYQQQREGMVYVDWVVFEHLYRFIRPFLVRLDDWTNAESLFRQLQLAINRPKRQLQTVSDELLATYFAELQPAVPTN